MSLLVEEQLKILQELENTGIVPVSDIYFNEGDLNDPELARRFALQALALAYGKKAGGFGPVFKSMRLEHGKLQVRFSHSRGLRSGRGRPLGGFEIAGADGNFTSASASIGGDAEGAYVTVWNEAVPNPVMVRYDWAYSAIPANLVNRDGIPALPFRADIRQDVE
jgi:sialate O-acetylesterase